MAVDHYENFPVASWWCPAPLRPPIRAIYAFARTADDIADEGDAVPAERAAALRNYREELRRVAAGGQPARWESVFVPLQLQIERHQLPVPLLEALLDAFEQDVRNPAYPDRQALLDYCRRSANPIGRLLLHLYGVTHTVATARSDAVCTALQLINFWQDLSVDLPRGRVYLPQSDAARHGLSPSALAHAEDGPPMRALVQDLCRWAHSLMNQGAPLVHELPGRAGVELRLVVQGGLRVLEKIRRMDYATASRRPTLGALDAVPLAWRALRMRPAREPLESAA